MGRGKIIGVLAAAALAGCGPGVQLDGLVDAGRGVVAEVPAGDLLVLADGRRVRLAGVEAPRPGEAHAEAARATLGRLVLGREVELLAVAPSRGDALQVRDRKTRRWIQGALLEAGAARVRTGARDRAMAAVMLDAEARARLEGRGLWKEAAYRVAIPSEIAADARGFRLVEGRVRHVGRSGRGVYLDFGEGPEALSVEMPAAAATDFALAGRPVEGLVSELVRVRGEVQGMRLRIDHPEALERLDPKRAGP